jgi:outer membrane protein TolC
MQEKAPQVPGIVRDFNIDPVAFDLIADLPVANEAPDFLGTEEAVELGARVISLEKALEIAFKQNRNYINQKENVYLSALQLAVARDQFRPFWRAQGSAGYARSTQDVQRTTTLNIIADEAPGLITAIGGLTGQPADLISRYAELTDSFAAASGANLPRQEIMNERSVDGSTSVGVSLLMAGGARIALDLTSNFLRFLTGDPSVSAASALTGSVTRPLLRGAGSRIVQEQLTQTERNLLYDLRDFTRFRKEFAVQVTNSFYRVLQDRDALSNNYQGYLAFQQTYERENTMYEEGRRTGSDVGRQQEALLSNQDSWVQSIRRYSESLDSFKILLGLSTDANVMLDPSELDMLSTQGLAVYDIPVVDAVTIALAARLDLYTSRDAVEDAERGVIVAKNALLPDIDLLINGRVNSKAGTAPLDMDFQRAVWSAGLDVNLPTERLAERNNYRLALISRERSQRAMELAEDNVKLQVRGAWRNLAQARSSYAIRNQSVKINQDRVEMETMLLEEGRGTTLAQIDAQIALTASQNSLTGSLVDYNIALLEFWRDMGILFIKANGQWDEVTDTEPERTAPVTGTDSARADATATGETGS